MTYLVLLVDRARWLPRSLWRNGRQVSGISACLSCTLLCCSESFMATLWRHISLVWQLHRVYHECAALGTGVTQPPTLLYTVCPFVCLSVHSSVCLSRPSTDSSPGEIETPGFYHRVRHRVSQIHSLAAYHNKHCWRAFRGYQHRWPWTPK